MATRTAALGLVLVGILLVGTATVPGWARDHENQAASKKSDRPAVLETKHDFMIWRQKAQVELAVLQAQVEAKKAEILLRDADFRAQELGPDLAILRKLDRPVPMSFPTETPLEDVLKYIKSATTAPNDHGIPIYIDPESLDKVEKTMTSPVVIELEGVPLRTSLRLVLKQLGLTYNVEAGLLRITAEPVR